MDQTRRVVVLCGAGAAIAASSSVLLHKPSSAVVVTLGVVVGICLTVGIGSFVMAKIRG